MLIGKNKRKMGKKALCLIFAFLFSINSFAAVVSDNDGSAFITKAEFDSLENNFQSQLDAYNTSIDSKIDAAIASYLAGINIGAEVQIKNNKSILNYPLTIYNFENELTKDNWDNQSASDRWWAPDETYWSVYCQGQSSESASGSTRSAWIQADIIDVDIFREINGKNKIKKWYYLDTWSTIDDYAIISGVETDIVATINHRNLSWTRDDWFAVRSNYGYCLFEGQSNYTSRGDQDEISFTNLYNSGDLLCKSNEYPLTFSLVPYFSSNSKNNWSSSYWSNNYEKITHGGGWYRNTGAVPNDWLNNNVSKTSTLTNRIDTLYNYANSKRYLPVTYNGIIYYSNKKEWKYNYLQDNWVNGSAKPYYENQPGGPYFTSPRLHGFVDAGWCLEIENYPLKSSRSWTEMSLINYGRLCYLVNMAVSKRTWRQSIIDGIFLTEIPEGEYKNGNIKINIDLSSMSVPAYIVMSKNPIGLYGTAYATGDTFLDLYKNKSDTTSAKKIELKNGDNTIWFKNIDNNDKLFFKLVWDLPGNNWETGNDINKIVITSEPKVTLEKET